MIEDNGPGIPEELQENIFKKGFTTKEGRGLGLGLPLAATVVRGMGGTLKLQATSLHGSTFVIVLPSSESPVEDLFRGDGSNMISRSYDGDEDSDVPDK
jgi:signal transduction histidine kinase